MLIRIQTKHKHKWIYKNQKAFFFLKFVQKYFNKTLIWLEKIKINLNLQDFQFHSLADDQSVVFSDQI